MRFKNYSGVLIAILFLIFSIPSTDAINAVEEKPMGEIKTDKALVYFICRDKQGFTDTPMYLMSDDQFLGILDDNGYNYAYIESGKHYLWHTWWFPINEFEFLPGQTYYLDLGRDRYSLLDELEGKTEIANVKYFFSADEKNFKKAHKILKKHYNKAFKIKKKDDEKRTIIQEVSPPNLPVDVASYLKVDEFTSIKLILIENISSQYNKTGETVLLEVKEDVVINNYVFIRKGEIVNGVIRESKHATDIPRCFLDIVIPYIKTTDGQLIPTVGRIFAFGEPGFSFYTGFMFITESPTDAYLMYGHEITVLTRNDAWIDPTKNEDSNLNNEFTQDKKLLKIDGNIDKPSKHVSIDKVINNYMDIEIVFPVNQTIKEIYINRINGVELPLTYYPKTIKYDDEQNCRIVFSNRDFVRFLPVQNRINIVELKGSFLEGEEFCVNVIADFIR